MKQLFIDERLNYLGMYNWTNDLPSNTNARNKFLNILEYLNKKLIHRDKIYILEIGTFTGTSLVNILENVPKAIACVIDKWKPYNECELIKTTNFADVKKTFYTNLQKANVINRLNTVFEGESKDILIERVKIGDKYDFIYVDGSHRLLDVYIDLVLSFEILQIGGILGIDDTTYNKEQILESPYEAVIEFLEKYKDRYILLENSYRIFIEKTKD